MGRRSRCEVRGAEGGIHVRFYLAHRGRPMAANADGLLPMLHVPFTCHDAIVRASSIRFPDHLLPETQFSQDELAKIRPVISVFGCTGIRLTNDDSQIEQSMNHPVEITVSQHPGKRWFRALLREEGCTATKSHDLQTVRRDPTPSFAYVTVLLLQTELNGLSNPARQAVYCLSSFLFAFGVLGGKAVRNRKTAMFEVERKG